MKDVTDTSKSNNGLTQRKPWSAAPWEEEMVIKALSDICVTIERQGHSMVTIKNVLIAHWCSLHSLPRKIACIPKAEGGLGLEPWDGESKLVGKLPRIKKPVLKFEGITKWRKNRVMQLATEEKIPLTNEQAKKIANEELTGVIASDDIPEAARALRSEWKKLRKELRSG